MERSQIFHCHRCFLSIISPDGCRTIMICHPHSPRSGVFSMASLVRFSLLLVAAQVVLAASSEKPLEPCTIRSPSSKAFFDLNPIARHPATDKELEKHKNDEVPWEAHSWHAKGHDYGANFTINFCAPVVEHLKDVEGVGERLWQNVSAFYEKGGRTYSIG